MRNPLSTVRYESRVNKKTVSFAHGSNNFEIIKEMQAPNKLQTPRLTFLVEPARSPLLKKIPDTASMASPIK
jgi:hypothetical protein